MINWRPIETAPKHTPIFTDKGVGIWTIDVGWYSCPPEVRAQKLAEAIEHNKYPGSWYLCHVNGTVPTCVDLGCIDSAIEPTRWCELSEVGL